MRILDRSIYVGPSHYARFPVIRLELDLGELEAWPTARLGKEFTPHFFKGAGHGFLRAQDQRNGANAEGAKQAWPLTIAFLRKHLGDGQ